MSTPIKGRVALSLLAAVASSAAVPLAPSGLRPPLRGLRGGATPSKLLWVRSPDDDTLRVVRSLSSFCEEHELDEDAMLAVSRGEAEDHEGWQCGVASEYEPPTKSAAGKSDGAAEAIEEDEAVEVVETEPLEEEEEEEGTGAAAERPAPPPPQMSKMVIGLVAPMAVLQVLKAFDQSSAEYLMGLRGAFFGIIALNTLVQLLLEWRIAATKDATPVQAPFNPLSMLMGGATKKEQTAREYDREQLQSLRNSYRMGVMFTCFLHFKMKMQQPLVYSSVGGVVDLFFNPLVNIHLFGRKPEGAYARPFGGAPGGAPGGQPQGMPDLSALLNPGGAKRPAVSQSSSAKE